MRLDTKIKERLKNIQDAKTYSVKEIYELGVIINTRGESSLHTIYRLLKRSAIPAMDVGAGNDVEPRYLVQGSDLRKYVESKLPKTN